MEIWKLQCGQKDFIPVSSMEGKKKSLRFILFIRGRSESFWKAWPSWQLQVFEACGSRNSSCNHQWIPTVLRTKSRFLNKSPWPLLTWLATFQHIILRRNFPPFSCICCFTERTKVRAFHTCCFLLSGLPFSLLFLILYLVNSS